LTDIIKNNDYTVEITGLTHEGLGVGRINNLAIFVKGAIPGETILAKVIKINKSYAVGKLLKIIKASENRAEPFCKVYGKCGGCSLQHMDYSAQLKFKTDMVRENLKRIGKLEDVIVNPAIGMENSLRYRNKAQFPVGMADGRPVIGFYSVRSHNIIDSETCGIQDELSDRVREVVRKFIAENKVSVYDEVTGKGLVRHVMTRVGFKTGEVMVVIVVNGKKLPFHDKLVRSLTDAVPDIKSIVLNVNTQKSNVILGSENITLFGRDVITDYIGKFKFEISPLSFYQVNPVQTEVLYEKALEYAGLTGSETVFDLYCGIGTISLFLSQKAKKVYGVEVVEDAIRDAKRNAEINGVDNCEFIVGEAEKVIPELYGQGVKADVVVVDPPRKGCDEVLLQTLVDMAPKRIVYVSCNPSTLARDLGYLSERGFEVNKVQPVDMFPYTSHVECVTLMSRVEK